MPICTLGNRYVQGLLRWASSCFLSIMPPETQVLGLLKQVVDEADGVVYERLYSRREMSTGRPDQTHASLR